MPEVPQNRVVPLSEWVTMVGIFHDFFFLASAASASGRSSTATVCERGGGWGGMGYCGAVAAAALQQRRKRAERKEGVSKRPPLPCMSIAPRSRPSCDTIRQTRSNLCPPVALTHRPPLIYSPRTPKPSRHTQLKRLPRVRTGRSDLARMSPRVLFSFARRFSLADILPLPLPLPLPLLFFSCQA